jgi:hypothetical protein
MITSVQAAEPAILIAGSGSPSRDPPTAAPTCAWVPVSVSVTTRTCGNRPRALAPCGGGVKPPHAALAEDRSGER